MKSTTSISLNLQLPNYSVAVYAVQGDTMSREIEAALFDGQTPFTPPAGALGTVRYYKPDGTSGFYDTLEDEETVAVTWDDNVAIIRLAEQTVTVPGEVLMQLSFYSADAERLSAFTFRLFVEKNPYSDQEFESTDYYSVLTARIAAVLNATTHAPSINNLGHWVLWDETAQQYYDSGINAIGPQGPTGPTGPQGTSIVSTSKASGTGAAGTTDVYNVNLSDGTVAGTFNVYQGKDGQGSPGSATPLMDGTPSAGSASAYAREDHVHPKDTSKLDAADFVLSNANPLTDGTANPGTSTEIARADHVHPENTGTYIVKEGVTVYRNGKLRVVRIDSPSAWCATLYEVDRPSVAVSESSKIFNGSAYVDCRATVGTDGTVKVTDYFGGEISGAQYGFLSSRYISYFVN